MGIGMIAICLPIIGPPLVVYLRKLLSSGKDINVSGSEPLTVHVEKIENRIHQSTTLGSVNTQDIQSYAKGKIHGDDEQIQIWPNERRMSETEERQVSLSEQQGGTAIHMAL